jgi:hypothetical protein
LYILIVTWFYFNQPPVNYQTEFTSAETCEAARFNLLHEEIRLREESQDREKQDQVHGNVRGTVPPPTLSVVCTKK